MAEVFVEFAESLVGKDGNRYVARACGGETARGIWQGWVEFLPTEGGEPIRSSRETTQPNRRDTEYWATGLTPIYLEGALDRALSPLTTAPARPPAAPVFDGPAPDINAPAPPNDAVLNPFSVYRKGEALLRSQLTALSVWHLVNIVTAYDLTWQTRTTLSVMPAAALVELIIGTVRERVNQVPAAD